MITLQEIALDPSQNATVWQNFLMSVVTDCYHSFQDEESPNIENLTQAVRDLFKDKDINSVFDEDVYVSIAKRVLNNIEQSRMQVQQTDIACERAEQTIVASLTELRSIGDDDVDEDAVTRVFKSPFDDLNKEVLEVLERHYYDHKKGGEEPVTVVDILIGLPLPPKEVGAEETPLPPSAPPPPEDELTDAGELPPEEDPPFVAKPPGEAAARIETELAAEDLAWLEKGEKISPENKRREDGEWYPPTPNQPSSRFGILILALLALLGAILAAVALRQTQEIEIVLQPAAAAAPVVKPVTEPLPTSVLPPEPPPAPLSKTPRAHKRRHHKELVDTSF